jgi:hypothetical protein
MAAFASQQALAAKVNVAGAKLNMKKTSARKAVKAFSARAQAVAAPAVRLIPDAALNAVARDAPARARASARACRDERALARFPRGRGPFSPRISAQRPRTSPRRDARIFLAFRRCPISPGIGRRAYPFRGARDLRARRVARADLARGGSRGARRPRGAARASSAAAPGDNARRTRGTHGGPKRDRVAVRRVEIAGVANREIASARVFRTSAALFFSRREDPRLSRRSRFHRETATDRIITRAFFATFFPNHRAPSSRRVS